MKDACKALSSDLWCPNKQRHRAGVSTESTAIPANCHKDSMHRLLFYKLLRRHCSPSMLWFNRSWKPEQGFTTLLNVDPRTLKLVQSHFTVMNKFNAKRLMFIFQTSLGNFLMHRVKNLVSVLVTDGRQSLFTRSNGCKSSFYVHFSYIGKTSK